MPSTRPQVNVRLTDEGHARFLRLLDAVPAALGVPVSQATVIDLALAELERKYPASKTPAADPPRPRAKGR